MKVWFSSKIFMNFGITMCYYPITSIENGSISTVCPLWFYHNLGPKNLTNILNYKLYQDFMYNFMCEIVLIFPIYVLFTKWIDTFWYRDITIFWGQEADKKINKDFWTTSSLHLPKCPNICTLYTIVRSPHHKHFGNAQHPVLWALYWQQLFSTR